MAADTAAVLLQLMAARSSIDAAIGALAGPQLEMPPGFEAGPSTCQHPKNKRHDTFGGHGYCAECGAKW